MNTEMNPQGEGRQSQKINGLPFLDMKKLTRKSLKRAEKGCSVYIEGTIYKLYHLGSYLFPGLKTKVAGKFY